MQQIINKVMADGKKSLAERIVYDALDIVSRRTGQPRRGARELDQDLTPVLEVCPAASAAPPTRCLSRYPPAALAPWRCAG